MHCGRVVVVVGRDLHMLWQFWQSVPASHPMPPGSHDWVMRRAVVRQVRATGSAMQRRSEVWGVNYIVRIRCCHYYCHYLS